MLQIGTIRPEPIFLGLRLRDFRATQLSLQKRIATTASSRYDPSDPASAARTALTARMVRSAVNGNNTQPAGKASTRLASTH